MSWRFRRSRDDLGRLERSFLPPGEQQRLEPLGRCCNFVLLDGPSRVNLLGADLGALADESTIPDAAFLRENFQAFLAAVNAALFDDINKTGRITKIELYEPPHVNIGGVWERFGIGTVKVTASKFRVPPGGGQEKIAERVVKAVQKSLRMKPSAMIKQQVLDLRKDNDRRRSHLLRRLRLLERSISGESLWPPPRVMRVPATDSSPCATRMF